MDGFIVLKIKIFNRLQDLESYEPSHFTTLMLDPMYCSVSYLHIALLSVVLFCFKCLLFPNMSHCPYCLSTQDILPLFFPPDAYLIFRFQHKCCAQEDSPNLPDQVRFSTISINSIIHAALPKHISNLLLNSETI